MDKETVFEGKPAAALSYFTFVGLLIAYSMNGDAKNPFASFHIRQATGLTLSFFLLMFPLSIFDSWMVSGPFLFTYYVIKIYALITAFQGQMTPIPVIGTFFQKIFSKNR